jgi:F0F1-type ATP synthase membrane subunit c/vacuolar-type H+-ATPase subunit K
LWLDKAETEALRIMSSGHMTVQHAAAKSKRQHDKERDTREKFFYLFLLAQICAIFGMVVGVLFFIARIIKLL